MHLHMSNTILRLNTCVTFLLLSVISCNNEQALAPGISLYKTRGDYFDLADIGMKGDQITRLPDYYARFSRFIITDTDTVYKNRAKLINGYILDVEADETRDVFLDLTFKQYMALASRGHLREDTLKKYILDKDPYVEFYRDIANPRRFDNDIEYIDTSEINQIIGEGKIEEFFTRLK